MASVKIYLLCQDVGDYQEWLEPLHAFTKREEAELTKATLPDFVESQYVVTGEAIGGKWLPERLVIVEVNLT